MTTSARSRCCGFSLFEFAVAAALLGIFITLVTGRLLAYHAEAERVATTQLVGILKAALQVRAGQAVIASGEQGLAAVIDENPIGWLSEKPTNYLGEFYAPEIEQLPSGSWLFDRADKSLVYLFNRPSGFSREATKFLKFKVKSTSFPIPAGHNGRSKVTKGLSFDQVTGREAVNTN